MLHVQIKALQKGLLATIPVDILGLWAWQELEELVCGSSDIDIGRLQNNTQYIGVSRTDEHVKRESRGAVMGVGEVAAGS